MRDTNNFFQGFTHPTLEINRKSYRFFKKKNFSVALGPEMETSWYNFDFLRVPDNHPARDTQDTFWLENGKLLRTQTSAVQGRVTEKLGYKPPLRVISPGKVFRNENVDTSHEALFYQLEGFVIDKNISMAHLLALLEEYINNLLGKVEIKFYPHTFPYVEPGMEVAIKWKGKWLEVLGCGMIHPQVLDNMKIDKQKYKGFAFGLGADRFAMLLNEIQDIRLLYHPDIRQIVQN